MMKMSWIEQRTEVFIRSMRAWGSALDPPSFRGERDTRLTVPGSPPAVRPAEGELRSVVRRTDLVVRARRGAGKA
jgi:hypothetical protein